MWGTQPVLHHHPCKEGQPEGQGSPGTQGLAVGGPWPSHQETQFKSYFIHLRMIPYALQLLAVAIFSHTYSCKPPSTL